MVLKNLLLFPIALCNLVCVFRKREVVMMEEFAPCHDRVDGWCHVVTYIFFSIFFVHYWRKLTTAIFVIIVIIPQLAGGIGTEEVVLGL